jgi:hypothetical protein
MDQAYYEQVARREEFEYERASKEIERANDILSEMARDDEFREVLSEKYPILKGWK